MEIKVGKTYKDAHGDIFKITERLYGMTPYSDHKYYPYVYCSVGADNIPAYFDLDGNRKNINKPGDLIKLVEEVPTYSSVKLWTPSSEELSVILPLELIHSLDLHEDDDIQWICNENGSYTVQKREEEPLSVVIIKDYKWLIKYNNCGLDDLFTCLINSYVHQGKLNADDYHIIGELYLILKNYDTNYNTTPKRSIP